MSTPQNIHPTFGQLLGREAKETLLNQRGLVAVSYTHLTLPTILLV